MSSLLLGLAIGVVVGALFSRLLAGRQAAPADVHPASSDEDPQARVQSLAAALLQVGEGSAHPRDIASNPLFQEAVAMFRSARLPIPVLTDYLIGANWMLASAACAALAEELATSGPLFDRETFRAAATRVRERTGQKGKALFHPIRLALTGEPEGMELDLAVPAIERGAALRSSAIRPIPSAAARAAAFHDHLRH